MPSSETEDSLQWQYMGAVVSQITGNSTFQQFV